jgi:hypothetical protein
MFLFNLLNPALANAVFPKALLKSVSVIERNESLDGSEITGGAFLLKGQTS